MSSVNSPFSQELKENLGLETSGTSLEKCSATVPASSRMLRTSFLGRPPQVYDIYMTDIYRSLMFGSTVVMLLKNSIYDIAYLNGQL